MSCAGHEAGGFGAAGQVDPAQQPILLGFFALIESPHAFWIAIFFIDAAPRIHRIKLLATETTWAEAMPACSAMMIIFPALLIGFFATSGRTVFARPSALALAVQGGVRREGFAASRAERRELIVPEALLNHWVEFPSLMGAFVGIEEFIPMTSSFLSAFLRTIRANRIAACNPLHKVGFSTRATFIDVAAVAQLDYRLEKGLAELALDEGLGSALLDQLLLAVEFAAILALQESVAGLTAGVGARQARATCIGLRDRFAANVASVVGRANSVIHHCTLSNKNRTYVLLG